MEKETMQFIIEIAVTVAAFLIGRHLLPKYKATIQNESTVQNALAQFELLLKYAESFCAYARQFLTDYTGSEKMDDVVENLDFICEDLNIEVDEETLRAIGQKAYDAMIAGENSAKVIIKSPVENLVNPLEIQEESNESK